MINLKEQKLKVKLTAEGINELLKQLNDAYPFVINSNKLGYLELFSDAKTQTAFEYEGELACGDILLVNNSILYYKIPKEYDYVIIGAVSNNDTFAELNDLASKINEILNGINASIAGGWEETKTEENIINSLKEASCEIKFDKNEIKTTALLEDKFSYSLLKEIYNKRNTSMKNLIDTFGPERRERIEKDLASFEKAGLVTKDYVILCKKSNQQILQVSSKQAIEETSQSSFKCFICGNPIANEEIDEIITCSALGKKLLTNDYWLLIKFLDHLDDLSIKKENIFVQSDNQLIQKVFVRQNQKLIFVVICNKKLELNDSYQLSSLINTFNTPYVILVSPGAFTHLMKSYLTKNSPDTQFIFIEELHIFEKEINAFFANFDKNLIEEIFEGFNNLTYVDLKDAIIGKVTGDEKEPAEVSAGAGTGSGIGTSAKPRKPRPKS